MPKELKLDPSKMILKGLASSDLVQVQEFKCDNGSMESFLKIEAYPKSYIERSQYYLSVLRKSIGGLFYIASITYQHHNLENTTKDALALARLAVAKEFQSLGVGTYIINKIKEIAYMTNEKYIKTDAVFERWEWYRDRGFISVIEDETDPEKTTGFVYMIVDLFDEKLVDDFCDV